LSAITFSIGTGVGLVARLFMPAAEKGPKIPPQVWVIGIAGLFGFGFADAGTFDDLIDKIQFDHWQPPASL
jgi:hypothetical protein